MFKNKNKNKNKNETFLFSLITQYGSRITNILLGLLIGAWTARYLSYEDLGKISYVSAFFTLASICSLIGLKDSVAILLRESPKGVAIRSTALILSFISTSIISLILFCFAISINDEVLKYIFIIYILGNFFIIFEIYEIDMLHKKLGSRIAFTELSTQILGAISYSLAIIFQFPVLLFGAINSAKLAFKGIFLFRLGNKTKQILDINNFSMPIAKSLLAKSLPCLISSISIVIFMRSDQLMIQWILGPAELARYSIAVRAAECIYFFPVILCTTYYPRLKGNLKNYYNNFTLQALYKTSWILGISMTLISIYILPFLVVIFFGDKYISSQSILVILAPASFMVCSGSASSCWLKCMNLEKVIAIHSIFGALLNVTLNIYLIPKTGISGAAIATSISYIVSLSLILLFWSPTTRRNALRLFFPFQLKDIKKVVKYK
tara:strand:- start:4137 stop:5444 length:1308 start_codon:yes stop_codon:yes gene_type:complete